MAKLYLLWDFEELCGVFSTLEKAKEAAREQIVYHKSEHIRSSRRCERGRIGKDFERRDQLPKHFKPSEWKYWSVGYEVIHDGMVHDEGVSIHEIALDKLDSLLKNIYRRKDARKRKQLGNQ